MVMINMVINIIIIGTRIIMMMMINIFWRMKS